MRILFATSEAFPLIKTGGLADVSGALPKALKELDPKRIDIKLIIPAYREVLAKLESAKPIADIVALGVQCRLLLGKLPNSRIEVIAVENAQLYERDGGPYNDSSGADWPDNALRFAVLSRIASLLCTPQSPLGKWLPDIVHCNDWQTGLVPAYLKLLDKSQTKCVFSIHNLAFQGNFDKSWLQKLELPVEHFNMYGFEYYGQLSFLKAGIFYTDQICTVSPTYAKEIQTEKFGFGMQGLLTSRQADLVGILNGIDTQEWNPSNDPHLPKTYSAKQLVGKKQVKHALQTQLGLKVGTDAPLLGIVSRLTYQKGLDLLPGIMPELIEKGCQFVILGSGEKALEDRFLALSKQFPSQVSVTIGYNESLSHNIMAGSDMFIMPSRFEPCGLNQLYGLAYGTPPIVSPTGGLADSVHDTNDISIKSKTATGFVMQSVNSASLLVTIERALAVWQNKKTWREIQRNGMERDISWGLSAHAYAAMYEKLV